MREESCLTLTLEIVDSNAARQIWELFRNQGLLLGSKIAGIAFGNVFDDRMALEGYINYLKGCAKDLVLQPMSFDVWLDMQQQMGINETAVRVQ